MKATGSRVLAGLLAVVFTTAMAFAQGGGKAHTRRADFGEHLLSYYTDVLDLTDAQQTQIKAIMTKEKPTIQPLIQQLAQTHDQMRQLEESSTFDETKVRAVAAQQAQTTTDLMVEKAKAKNEMFQILTADQKAKLQKLESRHTQRMLNHMQQGEAAPPSE